MYDYANDIGRIRDYDADNDDVVVEVQSDCDNKKSGNHMIRPSPIQVASRLNVTTAPIKILHITAVPRLTFCARSDLSNVTTTQIKMAQATMNTLCYRVIHTLCA